MRKYSITRALNLPEYKITEIISDTDKEIHIRTVPYKRKKALCSGCGEIHNGKIHSFKETVVEDRRLSGRRVYLHVIKRRYRCLKDGRLYVESVDWLKARSRVTNRLAQEVYRLTAIATNVEAGWLLGMDDEKVYRIDREILEELFKKKLEPPPAAVNISVDEVSYLGCAEKVKKRLYFRR